ncbi:lipid-A-disaccharide synthase [Leptospirillum ferriphilum]|uniref:Lipid-A-disaccharide synthase n=2 Tax=Leptospirillum ferriphilum TaxID=178606 RepID=A0A059XZ26_9BACT|nr:lipid-A-disaccharide synthase [Leptospirillum ferriphilum]AIA30472.1 lipid-A-disaccharide synthase [Leptospirillum ferriphilum YSK]
MAGRDDRGEAEKGEKKLLIVAGETSGDQHGAHLLSALKERDPTVEVWSVGGEKLRRAGARQIVGIERLSVIGLLEVFKKAGVIVSAFRAVLRKVDEEKIRTAVLIDFPDFNLRLAKALKKRGVRVLYYISPQVWAWRKGRIHQIRRDVNHMFVIFPFEKEMYEEAGVPVSYIGHPLLDEPFPTESPEDLQRRFFPDFSQKEKKTSFVLGLLPGSRESEVTRLYPRMLEAVERLRPDFPDIRILVPQAPGLDDRLFLEHEATYVWTKDYGHFQRIRGKFRKTVKACDLVILASGTATLETALLGVPMVIVYVMNPLTYLLARKLVRVPAIGMVNLIAGKTVMPELIQEAATPANMEKTVREILSDSNRLQEMKNTLWTVREKVGEAGASKVLAEGVMKFFNHSTN